MVVRSFRIPETVWQALLTRCERDGTNPTEVVRELVTDYVEDA